MSLSVEDVRFILSKLESCELATYDEDEQPCRGADKIISAALRELLAIKEAEPVAYIGNAYGDPVEFAEHELVVTGDIQKIPLFSHLIVRK